jgi:hypothetical protein
VPKGSAGSANAEAISTFWETVGTLAKHGLIKEDLLFDRYLISPYWERLKFLIEWLATKSEQWGKKAIARLQKSQIN